jgi:hypothetical protein
MALGAPAAVGHGVREDVNSRQYLPVGSGFCHRGPRRQDS